MEFQGIPIEVKWLVAELTFYRIFAKKEKKILSTPCFFACQRAVVADSKHMIVGRLKLSLLLEILLPRVPI
jgi:hypothetical protein